MKAFFLGGPLNGEQCDVPTPLPPVVHVSSPHVGTATFNPTMELVPQAADPVVAYQLRRRRVGDGHNAHHPVYVSDDYDPTPSLPIISRRFAAVCEQHGMREGVHFQVYPEAT